MLLYKSHESYFAFQKVWVIRIDLHFLDYDGNLIDCAGIAAITALLHFRRPDVTVIGEEVTIVCIVDFYQYMIEDRSDNPSLFSILSTNGTQYHLAFIIFQSASHLHSSTKGIHLLQAS